MPLPFIDLAATPPADNGGLARTSSPRDSGQSFDNHLQRAVSVPAASREPAGPAAPIEASGRSLQNPNENGYLNPTAGPQAPPAGTPQHASDASSDDEVPAAPCAAPAEGGDDARAKHADGDPASDAPSIQNAPPALTADVAAQLLPAGRSTAVAAGPVAPSDVIKDDPVKAAEPDNSGPSKKSEKHAKGKTAAANTETLASVKQSSEKTVGQTDAAETLTAQAGLQSAGPEATADRAQDDAAQSIENSAGGVSVDSAVTTDVEAAADALATPAPVDEAAVQDEDLAKNVQVELAKGDGKPTRRPAPKDRAATAAAAAAPKGLTRRSSEAEQASAQAPEQPAEVSAPGEVKNQTPFAALLANHDAAAAAAPESKATAAVSSTAQPAAGITPQSNGGESSAPASSSVRPLDLNARAATAAGGTNAGDVDRVRFVQRVAKAFQTAQDRGGALRLRLSPPELGALRLEVIVRQGVLSAKLEAETPAARTLLMDNLPQLRQRLAEQDIRIERFDVDLLGQSSSGGAQQQTDQGPSDRPARTFARSGKAASPAAAAPTVPRSAAIASDGGQLNVVI